MLSWILLDIIVQGLHLGRASKTSSHWAYNLFNILGKTRFYFFLQLHNYNISEYLIRTVYKYEHMFVLIIIIDGYDIIASQN